MSEFTKIGYYDLKLETLKGRLQSIVGRKDEISRITRVSQRHFHNNCLIVGSNGVGKTSLVHGWIKNGLENDDREMPPIVQLEAESFNALGTATGPILQKYKEAMNSLPFCILFIDNFGQLVYKRPAVLNYMLELLKSAAESDKVRLLLTMESKEFKWLEAEQSNFLNFFEIIHLKPQPLAEQYQILERALNKFRKTPGQEVGVGRDIFDMILHLIGRFPALGQLPIAAISILDECLALARFKRSGSVSEEELYQVVSDKIGVPLNHLRNSEKELLRNLEGELNTGIIGQKVVLRQIVSSVRRAKLGLKNPNRPLGSFLMLGPSGVGKTETAKLVAQKVFGKKESFVRIDMSEFGEAHTVARLIGAPAGYVGYDTGGGLTNAVKQEPYSLILLDEIEKAHPKVFDVFLQILDDGRLTSAQGETVDFSQTIIMATSNLVVREIIQGFASNQDINSEAFFQNKIVSSLTKTFRLEFLNRFDAVLVFKPLTEDDLLEIAKLEIRKVEERVAKHKIRFKIDPAVLAKKIKTLADPRFGARPIKRFIETACEDLISQKLLS